MPQSQAVSKLIHVFPRRAPTPPTSPASLSPTVLASLTKAFESCFTKDRAFYQARGQELIHHFMTTTSWTLATHTPTHELWQVTVPGIAATHSYLIRGIVAATSLHLAQLHDDAETKQAYGTMALDQMNVALVQYRKDLSHITQENCEPLYIFSILTHVFVFRTVWNDAAALEEVVRKNGNVDVPWMTTQWTELSLKLLNGVRGGAKAILNPSWFWLLKGPLASLCSRDWWPKDRILKTPQSLEDDKRLHDLERMWLIPGKLWDSSFDQLKTAQGALRESFALVHQLTDEDPVLADGTAAWPENSPKAFTGTLMDRGAVFVWPVSLTQEFVGLLQDQKPEAMVLFAHWAILFHRLRDLWFCDGLARPIVMAAAAVLGKERLNWIEWPIKEVGLEIPDWI